MASRSTAATAAWASTTTSDDRGSARGGASPAPGKIAAAAGPTHRHATESTSIRPVAGILLTGTISDHRISVTNPDGSIATGSLSGRYEVFAGAEFPIDPNGLALRLTAGLHVSSSFSGSSGSEHATSLPFEATVWYPLNDTLRLGAGARYAMHTRFSGAGNKTADNLNPTPSLVLGAGYRLMPHLLLGMRYVYERYEQAKGDDLDASHWGVGLTAIY